MAKNERPNPITKVEANGRNWSKVTVKDDDGQTRTIRVRQGSLFADRPKPTRRPA